MGHLTSRFGNVSPQGKVIGCESSSIAVSLEESSPMAGPCPEKIYFRYTRPRRRSESDESGHRMNGRLGNDVRRRLWTRLVK